jgi:hypothetical protein
MTFQLNPMPFYIISTNNITKSNDWKAKDIIGIQIMAKRQIENI